MRKIVVTKKLVKINTAFQNFEAEYWISGVQDTCKRKFKAGVKMKKRNSFVLEGKYKFSSVIQYPWNTVILIDFW